MNILSLFAPVTTLIDELVTTDEERLKLNNELEKIKSEVDKQILVVGGKVVDAEARIREADFKARELELKSDSWLVRHWRPFMMMALGLPMLFNFIALPFLKMTGHYDFITEITLSPEYWTIVQTFYGVYGGGRTLEKIVKHIRK